MPVIVSKTLTMAKWTRKPQECEGSYFFSGTFYVTRGAGELLSPEEIIVIYREVQRYVADHNGADYLFVFENEKGDKLFFIDQLNKGMIESGHYKPEDNHCTLLCAHEY
jgi:hypothetical protein